MQIEKPDFVLRDEGSIVLLLPLSDNAQEWVDENIGEAAMYGRSLVIEHRYANNIINGIIDDGLEIG